MNTAEKILIAEKLDAIMAAVQNLYNKAKAKEVFGLGEVGEANREFRTILNKL